MSGLIVFLRLLPTLLRAIIELEKIGLTMRAEYLISQALNSTVDDAIKRARAAASGVKDDTISTDPDNRDNA